MTTAMADRIAHELGERVRLGELSPGARLRQEHVGREFDASPGPVREAFRRMEARGLVESRPRRGVVVTGIDAASTVEVSDMRTALEPLALRHAIPKMTGADLAAVRTALQVEAGSDLVALERANRDFHRAILAPCAMPRLMQAIDDLHISASRILLAMWRDLPDWPDRSSGEHEAIFAAIEARDADAAASLLARHIAGGRDALVAWIKNGRSFSEEQIAAPN